MAKKIEQLNERDTKVLKNKVRRTKTLIREATAEIRKLVSESKKGTLGAKRLDSGLMRVSQRIEEIPPHWPYNHR